MVRRGLSTPAPSSILNTTGFNLRGGLFRPTGLLRDAGQRLYVERGRCSGGSATIQAGKLVFDYTGASDPAATIATLLAASYHNGQWDVGQFRDSTAASSGLTLGMLDDPVTHQVKVMATYAGDFNLDGVVNALDNSIWFANAFATGSTWAQGDANYDGVVDGLDRDLWSSHVGLPALPGIPTAGVTPAPEPGTLALLAAGLLGLLAYRRKQAGI